MSHFAKAIVLHCIDFRFVDATREFLHKQGYKRDHDDCSIAGAVKNIVDPHAASDVEFAFRQIAIAHKLHSINDVILINHTDCGAYGGHVAFASFDEERKRHAHDLRRAKEMIEERFKDEKLTVIPVLAVLQSDHSVRFEKE